MVHVEGEISIDRPVEVVFDVIADERNEPLYNPKMAHVLKLTEGPIDVGTQFLAEARSLAGVTPMVIEFTRFERPQRLSSVTRLSAMDIQGSLTFEPLEDGTGTRMRWDWDIEPKGIYRIMTPLIIRIGERDERACWAGLKHYLERED